MSTNYAKFLPFGVLFLMDEDRWGGIIKFATVGRSRYIYVYFILLMITHNCTSFNESLLLWNCSDWTGFALAKQGALWCGRSGPWMGLWRTIVNHGSGWHRTDVGRAWNPNQVVSPPLPWYFREGTHLRGFSTKAAKLCVFWSLWIFDLNIFHEKCMCRGPMNLVGIDEHHWIIPIFLVY